MAFLPDISLSVAGIFTVLFGACNVEERENGGILKIVARTQTSKHQNQFRCSVNHI